MKKEICNGTFCSNLGMYTALCSSDMSICSSLVALMALSFSPPLMKIVCFCSTGFYQCRCNKLQGCP